jgi:hypothetical protein
VLLTVYCVVFGVTITKSSPWRWPSRVKTCRSVLRLMIKLSLCICWWLLFLFNKTRCIHSRLLSCVKQTDGRRDFNRRCAMGMNAPEIFFYSKCVRMIVINLHLKFELFPKPKRPYVAATKFVTLSPKQRRTKAFVCFKGRLQHISEPTIQRRNVATPQYFAWTRGIAVGRELQNVRLLCSPKLYKDVTHDALCKTFRIN